VHLVPTDPLTIRAGKGARPLIEHGPLLASTPAVPAPDDRLRRDLSQVDFRTARRHNWHGLCPGQCTTDPA